MTMTVTVTVTLTVTMTVTMTVTVTMCLVRTEECLDGSCLKVLAVTAPVAN